MHTDDFLNILAEQGLIAPETLSQLRQQAAQHQGRLTPAAILKFLVQQGLVSRDDAKQLLRTTLTLTPQAEAGILGPDQSPPPSEPTAPLTLMPAAGSDATGPADAEVLTLMPIEETHGPADGDATGPADAEVLTLLPIEETRGPANDDAPASAETPTLMPIEEERADDDAPALQGWTTTELSAAPADAVVAPPESSPEPPPAPVLEEVPVQKLDPVAQPPSAPRRPRRSQPTSEWDSPLLIFGGGGLLFLLLVGAIVGLLINREDAEAVLTEARDAFAAGAYRQAIQRYDHFVNTFPSHPQASTAKVKLGMAKLWQATKIAADPERALHTAQQVLDEVQDEAEFRSAQRDLASLLPEIAQGLAAQAEAATVAAEVDRLVEQTNLSLALCTNTKFVTRQFRDDVVLDEVRQTLARIQQSRVQNEQLATGLSAIQAALATQDTAEAYRIHRQLWGENPGLLQNEQLAQQLINISAAEADTVQFHAETIPAATDPRSDCVTACLVPAVQTAMQGAPAEGTVAVRMDGSVYGLSARDGTVLWQIFVGHAPGPVPQTLPNGDFLVVDAVHHDLLRLAGPDGTLLWRSGFQSALTTPVVFASRVLVAEQTGKLHVTDLATGARQGYIQFPQRLPVAPACSPRAQQIYVVGEHSSLFTLSSEDFSCLGVHFLGHAAGSIQTAPLAILDKVLVAENAGLTTSRLHILQTHAQGTTASHIRPLKLQGLVNTSLLSAGRRAVVVTSQGQVDVYEVAFGNQQTALTRIARRDADDGAAVARFGLLADGHVWLGGNQLSKLAVLPTGNRMPVQNLDANYPGDTFDHPLQQLEQTLIHVRRPRHRAGALVAAMGMELGNTCWETQLAVPVAGAPSIDATAQQITCLTAAGTAHRFQASPNTTPEVADDRKRWQQQTVWGAAVNGETRNQRVPHQSLPPQTSAQRDLPVLSSGLDLGQGRLAALAENSPALLHFRPQATANQLQRLELASPASCPAVAWGAGFVVPTQGGQVFLLDRATGKQLGSPFQPPVPPNAKFQWLVPAVHDESARLILSDGQEKIYSLSQATEPQPHLRLEEAADVEYGPLVTRLAVLGDRVAAGTEHGDVAVYALPTLTAHTTLALDAPIVWGPFATATHWIVATANEELIAVTSEGKITWRQPHRRGPPRGTPYAEGNDLFLLWQTGGVSRLAMDSGQEVAHTPLSQPALAGPWPCGKQLVVTTPHGLVLLLQRP